MSSGNAVTDRRPDEKRTTTQEFADNASTALKLLSKPATDLGCHVALVEHDRHHPLGLSIESTVRDRLRQATRKNFEGREYITRPGILQVLSTDVLQSLIEPYTSEWMLLEVAQQVPTHSTRGIIDFIDTEAKVLLALCIFVGAPTGTFFKLIEAGTRDSSLPLPGGCPTGVDQASFLSILEMQWTFMPHNLFAQACQVILPEDIIVPLNFDRQRNLIGSGAYSDVFWATVDNVNCSAAPVCLPSSDLDYTR